MAAALAVVAKAPASVFDLGAQLASLLADAAPVAVGDQLPDAARERAADLIEAIRNRVARRPGKDLRSLFDLDDRLIDLMDEVEQHSEHGVEIPQELAREIDSYLEAYRIKVDRIVGFWRWQESIAAVCGAEVERLAARKKAAENRIAQLKTFLLAFMTSRGIKRLDGEKAAIGKQGNSQASLVIDDPLAVPPPFRERSLRFSQIDLEQLALQLPEGSMRARILAELQSEAWEINQAAVRAALVNHQPVAGARLVKGEHVRIR